MGHSLLFMTFLAAQSPDVIYHNAPSSGCGCQQQQGQVQMMQDDSGGGFFSRMSDRMEKRPGLVNRIRDWFGRQDFVEAETAYEWCTDFRADDLARMGQVGTRKIERTRVTPQRPRPVHPRRAPGIFDPRSAR